MKNKIENLEKLGNYSELPLFFDKLNITTKEDFKGSLTRIPIPINKYNTKSYYKTESGFYKKITKSWKTNT